MAESKRYAPCPGGAVGRHAPCVFPELRKCKGKSGSRTSWCSLCASRLFAAGWGDAGLTAAQCRAMVPPGIAAMDGDGQAI